MISRVLIIGGGIGGLSTAIGLRQAGVEALVFEQQSDLRRTRVGGGIHIWTNAMRALQRLGLAERVLELGSPLERTEFVTRKGKFLAAWPLEEIGREYGWPDVGITRADLQRVLVDAQDPSAAHEGAQCIGFSQDESGVTAHFENRPDARGEVLVGSDGLRSIIRAQLLGDEPPRYAGYAQLQAVSDSTRDFLPEGEERIVFGCGKRAVLHHVGGGQLFWAGALYGREGSLARIERKREWLLEEFAGWGDPVETAIEATPEEGIVGFDIYDRPPVGRWGSGRVALVGDAAHPMTTNLSQGGCLALEDAVVLVDCLRDADDLPGALRGFEARRIQRTTPLVKQSYRIARIGGIRNRFGCALRDRMMGLTLGTVALKGHRAFLQGSP